MKKWEDDGGPGQAADARLRRRPPRGRQRVSAAACDTGADGRPPRTIRFDVLTLFPGIF